MPPMVTTAATVPVRTHTTGQIPRRYAPPRPPPAPAPARCVLGSIRRVSGPRLSLASIPARRMVVRGACVRAEVKTISGVTVESTPSEDMIEEMGITSWPIWTCGVSKFPWFYDSAETCLLLEGEVVVTPEGGDPVAFGAGDLVDFPAGMACEWDVKVAVKKHYNFHD